MPGKCRFKDVWLENLDYKDWLQCVPNDCHKARCTVCSKTFDVSNMGEAALRSHIRSKKHTELCSKMKTAGSIDNFFKKQSSDVLRTQATSNVVCSRAGVDTFTSRTDNLKAEILWTLFTVTSHHSYKSNETIGPLFKLMFWDSQIALRFTCGERKTAYMTVFGLAEYFKQQLLKDITGPFTVAFDESLNKKSQRKQMDIHILYWKDQEVSTRYFGSEFLGHAKAQDMVEHFTDSVLQSGLAVKDLTQISMDGPNVNWAFYEQIRTKLKDDYDTSLLNIGSCGLHVVHNSFKAGAVASGWDVDSVLKSLYYLFKDVPARQDDYRKVASDTRLPLKFANHRWLENVPVCDRVIAIWSDVVVYIKATEKKDLPQPSCRSYLTVKQATKDAMFLAKLQFFKSMALHLQPFLASYQTDKPMIPFLSDDLCGIIKALMRRFVKNDVLAANCTAEKLVKIDMDEKNNHVTYSKIDIGIPAEKELKGLKCSEKQIMEYRLSCKTFLIATVKKMLTKCPASYSLVRNLSCLSPRKMACDPEQCRDRFKRVLSLLVSSGKVKENDCELIRQEYAAFLDRIPAIGSEKFANFNKEHDRVDVFLTEHCMRDNPASKLTDTLKVLLVLSHGQASVERGFSVNKEIEVENLKEKSLIAQRQICDHVRSVGGVLNLDLCKGLLASAASARSRYEQYMEDERQKNKTDMQLKKRKRVLDEIDNLKDKRRRIKSDIKELNKSADQLAEKAEETGKLSFITKSNSLRKTGKEKQKALEEVEQVLNEKVLELKE